MTDPFHTPQVDAEVEARAQQATTRVDDSRAIDRRINAILVGIALVVLVTLGLAAIYFPQFASKTNDLSTSTRIQGCRTQSNAMVTAARTEFDVARAQRDTAATHLNLLIANGLVDVAKNDDDALAALLPEIIAATDEVDGAEEAVVAATAVLRDENARHQRSTQLSIENPEKYLRDCQAFKPL